MFSAQLQDIRVDSFSVLISGDRSRYRLRYSEGTELLLPVNGDQIVRHDVGADSIYDLWIWQHGAGLPRQHVRAFMYGGATDALRLGGSGLSEGFVGGSGDDALRGGGGRDMLMGNAGDDLLHGGTGDDYLHGGEGTDVLKGGMGDDSLLGGAGADTLIGGDGDDALGGGAGDDLLVGGAGDDLLESGTGRDRLVGGIGSDTFWFTGAYQDGSRALVADFEQGTDTLIIWDWFGTSFTFVGNGYPPIDGRASVWYEHRGGDTFVLGDAFGDGVADYGFRLAGTVDLTLADFGM